MNRQLNKILITGGAGYIGSVLSRILLEKKFNVRIIDNFLYGYESVQGIIDHPNFEVYQGDICQAEDVSAALKDIDCVIHLAAIVGDPACQKSPELAVKVNKEGSELMFETAQANNIKRFIFASTCSNYGKMPDPDGFVSEDALLSPVSHYAELKVAFEKYLLKSHPKTTKPVILRFATAYGLSYRMRFDLTVNEFTRALVLNQPLEIYGEQFWRPYCHLKDISEAIIRTIEADNDKVAFEAFNVGDTKENYQKKTLVEILLKLFPDKKQLVSFIAKDEDPRDYRVNFDKINNKLNFKSNLTVSDGIAEVAQAIQNNQFSKPFERIYSNS